MSGFIESHFNVFTYREQAKAFQDSMAKLFGEGGDPSESVALGFQKMAEAANLALKNDQEGLSKMDPEFAESIQEVLKGLSDGQEAAQNPFNAEDLAGMFSSLDMTGENGEAAGLVPFMQSMMQSLLSAEILLPSLKDLVEKYPKYLADNASTLSAADKEKYEKQLGLIKEVVEELEKEKATDSAETKKKRFDVVLERMQKMQDLGQPPAELLGDGGGASLPGFDPALNDQCCVM